MKTREMDEALATRACEALKRSSLFRRIPDEQRAQVATRALWVEFEANETVMEEGTPSDAFFIMLDGEATVSMTGADPGQSVRIARLRAFDTIGEMGLLLEQQRSATVVADSPLTALKFTDNSFTALFLTLPNFGRAISQALAARVQASHNKLPLPEHDGEDPHPGAELMNLLSVDFVQRHRIVPLERDGQCLVLGFVDDPSPEILLGIYRLLPGWDIRPVRVNMHTFDQVLRAHAGLEGWTAEPGPAGAGAEDQEEASTSPRLDALLRRMVTEGASDLHLAAGQRPYWRIEGELHPLEDTAQMGAEDVLHLFDPIMSDQQRAGFAERHEEEFGYHLCDVARFRINVYRDLYGASAALRQIPTQVPTIEHLDLPTQAAKLCGHSSGLILITGPAGSGRTTTLAAMVGEINRSRRVHIITLEDPIEFVHRSDLSLVNHREVGTHCSSFRQGLEAALREDPDVVLLGAVPDAETAALVLEACHDGLLVLTSLRQMTAVSAVEHFISLFPVERRPHVHALLADHLRGVVAQVLCRREGGGRVAAFETLILHDAIASALREGRTSHLGTLMATGSLFGNVMMNEALAQLVREKRIVTEEALSCSLNRQDLAQRLGRPSTKSLKDALRTTRIIKGRTS